jgi:VanZ family protein
MSPKMRPAKSHSAKGDPPPGFNTGRLQKKVMPIRLKSFLYYWLPLVLYCLLIYIQSDHPSPEKLPSFDFSDKVLHFVAYGILGVLFFRAYQTLRIKNNMRMLILLSVVSASLYGFSDEIHQYFIPYRDGDIIDVIADIFGAAAGVYLYKLLFLRKIKADAEIQMS